MRNFKEKKRKSSIWESKIVLILLGILIIVFTWNLIGFMNKREDTARNKRIAEDKITELEKVRTQLSADIGKLNTEEGVEENIREKFGLVKEGEEMIVIVEDKNPPVEEAGNKKSGFFSFFKNLFK